MAQIGKDRGLSSSCPVFGHLYYSRHLHYRVFFARFNIITRLRTTVLIVVNPTIVLEFELDLGSLTNFFFFFEDLETSSAFLFLFLEVL